MLSLLRIKIVNVLRNPLHKPFHRNHVSERLLAVVAALPLSHSCVVLPAWILSRASPLSCEWSLSLPWFRRILSISVLRPLLLCSGWTWCIIENCPLTNTPFQSRRQVPKWFYFPFCKWEQQIVARFSTFQWVSIGCLGYFKTGKRPCDVGGNELCWRLVSPVQPLLILSPPPLLLFPDSWDPETDTREKPDWA